ncbi:MAG TPA: DUF3501 family protein [Chloroflexota bacterium]|nr:DUF3501 family protein [Chloroflexota bacterium]
MPVITRDELRSLEEYEKVRAEVRRQIAAIKAPRRVKVGEWVALTFENRDTVRYQIQEMLRAERIFEPHRIQEEIDIYSTLLPNPGELSATMFIEIADMEQLKRELPRLVNIETAVWLDLGERQIHAAYEAGRSMESKTSTVHYLRFPVGIEGVALLRDPNVPARLRIEHPNYQASTELSPATRAALADDLAAAG